MFYAGYNRFGVNVLSHDYWHCYAFDTKKERDEWVAKHEYNPTINSGYIACKISAKDMKIIVPCHSWQKRYIDYNRELLTRDI